VATNAEIITALKTAILARANGTAVEHYKVDGHGEFWNMTTGEMRNMLADLEAKESQYPRRNYARFDRPQ
jgi:hypothetical protein